MQTVASMLAMAATASAAIQGFNYGSTFTTGAAKTQTDFENEFTTAQNLKGTSGWTSARLYTMVQGGTTSDPITAIPAAIKTKTSLLLGLWASGGDASFANEILALKAAIEQYGDDFAKLVDGISVGSEDLYRNSPMGIAAGSNVGAEPATIAKYIKETKDTIAGTALEGTPIGHVDTWTAWYNGTNQAVIDACDWLGMDAYPYFQDTVSNSISESASLFQEALDKTKQAGGGKTVWVTETGQPVSGKTVGQSVASTANAEKYWKDVVCPLIADGTNLWYYTLQDASPDTPDPSFGITGSTLSTTPLFDLSCDNASNSTSSSASSSSATKNGTKTASGSGYGSSTVTPVLSTGASATGTGSGSGSGVGSGSSANGTYTSPASAGSATSANSATSATASVPASGATGLQSGAFAAAFAAIMVAIYAL
ncbi:glycoside hydrolase superfamily [Hypoxylon sp. FL1150]|nr:glycoside hydrolase superfamily [Hypoxylon sp. FL1150]